MRKLIAHWRRVQFKRESQGPLLFAGAECPCTVSNQGSGEDGQVGSDSGHVVDLGRKP